MWYLKEIFLNADFLLELQNSTKSQNVSKRDWKQNEFMSNAEIVLFLLNFASIFEEVGINIRRSGRDVAKTQILLISYNKNMFTIAC